MRTNSQTSSLQNSQRDMVLLLLASIACVLILTISLVGDGTAGPAGMPEINAGQLLLVALMSAGVLAAAYLVTLAAVRARRGSSQAEAEVKQLRSDLLTAEALIKAEPQVLVYWDQGKPPVIVTQALTGVAGLPQNEPELLRFGMWLDVKSAASLRDALDELFRSGDAFNLILRTSTGGHLEADGRTAGGRAVLRLRDVAGYKRDLGVIAERHESLARDIRSSRALLDALPSPVWLKGADDKIVWVNKAYLKAVEAQNEDEVIGHQIELLESRQRKAADRVLKNAKPFRDRLALVIGGERKSHDVVVLPLGDATAGVAIDVDALASAQGNLDRQVAAYDRTLDRVSTAVAIFNNDKHLSFFNEAYLKLWHLEAGWLKSGPTDGAVLDRMRDQGKLPEVVHYREWKSKLIAAYSTGSGYEDWWHLPDGRIVHVMVEQRPDGGAAYLFDDQTERYALESRYNALIGVQTETLNSLKEGVAVFATDGRLQLFNTSFAAIWKQSRPVLASGPHIDEFIRTVRVLCDDTAAWIQIARIVTAFSDQREQVEGQMLRPDNSVIDYAATPLPDGGTLLTFADVTDARSYERALVERNEALVAADRLKNQFIGHVSYELRTPLTNIIGFSELLSAPFMGDLNPKQREYVDDIMSSSKTLLAIIDDILDLATFDAGALELKHGPVDVRAVIDQTIMGIRDRAARAHLTLDIAIAADAKEFVADESRVRQVLYNLLSNAVGFSRDADVVSISCWREAGYMVFRVEDHGAGIPKDQLPHVFDRFESRSQGSKHRGAGLGLSIVKILVELHGGTMTIASEPGIGTTVTVLFPERGTQKAGIGDSTGNELRLESFQG